MIIGELPDRGSDQFGSGHFGAPRGTKTHRGVDFACYPDTRILSPIDGIISKFGYPYPYDLAYRYVEIMNVETQNKHRLFYVEPDIPIGTEVKKGDYVGFSQNIAAKYSTRQKYMKNHVHYEIKHGTVYLDPNEVNHD